MNYSELIQAYFERSVALQWYWTLYVLVIGGIVGFSAFRQRREFVTAVLITILFACFAFKNRKTPDRGDRAGARPFCRSSRNTQCPNGGERHGGRQAGSRQLLEPTLTAYDHCRRSVRHCVHVACDLLTIAVLWVKEWRRKQTSSSRLENKRLSKEDISIWRICKKYPTCRSACSSRANTE